MTVEEVRERRLHVDATVGMLVLDWWWRLAAVAAVVVLILLSHLGHFEHVFGGLWLGEMAHLPESERVGGRKCEQWWLALVACVGGAGWGRHGGHGGGSSTAPS